MKNNLRMILMIAVCAVFFGSAANVFAQVSPPVVGGYSKTETTDGEVRAAANFAVKTQAKKQKATIKLVAVKNVAKQVVAGTNYQICLSVETTDRKAKTAVPQIIQTVVYKNLKGKYQLTSWAVAACADAAPDAPAD